MDYCNKFRENYKKCFEAYGSRQCKLELDKLFECLYANEFYIKPIYTRKPPTRY
jgi:hypothetical protein